MLDQKPMKYYSGSLRHCDLTLSSPAQNLACDEALLDFCDEGGSAEGLLRFWEPAEYSVVVGYANKVAEEVRVEYCRSEGIPILRRCSGGGTVLQGSGCLNYSLIVRIDAAGPFSTITGTNEFILKRHQAALATLLNTAVEMQGHTDLALGGLKFSGNAQRRKRHFLIFHGCFLLGLDIGRVEKALRMPSKQPEYRAERSHREFLVNLRVAPKALKAALLEAWDAAAPFTDVPRERIRLLTSGKYETDAWNFKF
jgi:lipoate-protein ligase A